MPIVGSALTTAIRLRGAMLGPDWLKVSAAVGSGVALWCRSQANVTLVGATAGAAGGGPVTGKFFMVPSSAPVLATVVASGLLGKDGRAVATAVGGGIGAYMNVAAGYRGQATGAIGADVSKVVFVRPGTLRAILRANFAAKGLRGVDGQKLASALATGIGIMFATGGGTGVATGPGGPAPSAGVTRSRLF